MTTRERAEEVAKQFFETYRPPDAQWYVDEALIPGLATVIAAEVQRAVSNVQHFCTKCGYTAITHSVETEQIVQQAVEEEREACAKIVEGSWHPMANALGVEYTLRQRLAADIRAHKETING